MAVMVAAIAGCAGDDDPSGAGSLAVVTDLQLDASSAGTSIVLVWSEVDGVDGYKVYFQEDATGNWEEVGTSSTTGFTHDATSAGHYSVKAYKGDDMSSDFATPVSTMPNIITQTFTIYDNNSALDSGFFFGKSAAQSSTGQAQSTDFKQDIYAYDDTKGDMQVSLYSGAFGEFGNGYVSYFQEPDPSVSYCDLTPSQWSPNSYPLYSGDSVVFVALTGSPQAGPVQYIAKMRGITIAEDGNTENGTMVTFSFEIQGPELHNTGLLSVFTTAHN